MYKVMFALHPRNPINFKWILFSKSVLNAVGFLLGMIKKTTDRNVLKTIVERQLKDQFIQSWFSNANNSSRG